MNDKEYLKAVIDSVKILHSHDYLIIFNTNLEIEYATLKASRLIIGREEDKKNEILYGRAINELPHPIAEKYDYIKSVITRPSNVSLIMVDSHFNDEYDLVPGIVSANSRTLTSPKTGNTVGYMCTYKVNPELSIGQLHKLIDHANFELNKSISSLKQSQLDLTPRQQHVLVLLLKNMSVKEIAAYLSSVENRTISHMTIHNIINGQLFKKFEVSNIYHLQKKVFSSNYYNRLLQHLLFKKYILVK